jgi:hypothetical protein
LEGGWFGLEEDHATGHEHVQIVEALVDVFVALGIDGVGAKAIAHKARVQFQVLPVDPKVHGGRINLLHDASTPTVNCRACQENVLIGEASTATNEDPISTKVSARE